MRYLLLLLVTGFIPVLLSAQTNDPEYVEKPVGSKKNLHYTTKWYIHPNFGYYNHLQGLDKGVATDLLVRLPKSGMYSNLISASYFPKVFGGKWGAELTFMTISALSRDKNNLLEDTLISTFNRRFEAAKKDTLTDFDEASMMKLRLMIGVNYRLIKDRWLLMPRLLFTSSSLDMRDYEGVWKETGTNIYYKYAARSVLSSSIVNGFTAGFTAGYAVGYQTILTFSATYTNFFVRLAYDEELTNLYTGEYKINRVDYSKSISTLALGVGLIFQF